MNIQHMLSQIIIFFQIQKGIVLCEKSEKSNHCLECAAPKRWSKYSVTRSKLASNGDPDMDAELPTMTLHLDDSSSNRQTLFNRVRNLFFKLVLPMQDIFLTTFYGLYCEDHCTFIDKYNKQLYSHLISAAVWLARICLRCDGLAGPCMQLCMLGFVLHQCLAPWGSCSLPPGLGGLVSLYSI